MEGEPGGSSGWRRRRRRTCTQDTGEEEEEGPVDARGPGRRRRWGSGRWWRGDGEGEEPGVRSHIILGEIKIIFTFPTNLSVGGGDGVPTTSFFFADLAKRNVRQQQEYRQHQQQIQQQLRHQQHPRRHRGTRDDETDSTNRTTTDEEDLDDASTQVGVGWTAGLSRGQGGEHYLY